MKSIASDLCKRVAVGLPVDLGQYNSPLGVASVARALYPIGPPSNSSPAPQADNGRSHAPAPDAVAVSASVTVGAWGCAPACVPEGVLPHARRSLSLGLDGTWCFMRTPGLLLCAPPLWSSRHRPSLATPLTPLSCTADNKVLRGRSGSASAGLEGGVPSRAGTPPPPGGGAAAPLARATRSRSPSLATAGVEAGPADAGALVATSSPGGQPAAGPLDGEGFLPPLTQGAAVSATVCVVCECFQSVSAEQYLECM